MKQKEAKLLHDKNKIIALKIFTQEIYDANAFSDENLFIDSSGLRSKFSKSDQIVDEQLWGWGGGKFNGRDGSKKKKQQNGWKVNEWANIVKTDWPMASSYLTPLRPLFPFLHRRSLKRRL